MESEKTRWMGVNRYKWLKFKRGFLAPRKHYCKIKYALNEPYLPVPNNPLRFKQELKTFYELQDEGAVTQHTVEMCSIYNEFESIETKQWMGNGEGILNPGNEDLYHDKWKIEEGHFITIGAANVYFEAEYSHPSDGNMDLIIVRKGSVYQTLKLAIGYIRKKFEHVEVYSYNKIKALVIEQNNADALNVDGEVFQGHIEYRIEIIPNLVCVLSEK